MFDRHWFPEITVQPPVRQEELKKTAQLVAKLTPAQRRCLSMADLRQGIVPDHVPGNVTADAPSVLATSCM
jgi:hypothetical protein